jgi:hypothetical protein
VTAASAARAPVVPWAGGAYDPSAEGDQITWQRAGGPALILRNGALEALPGHHPALGGGRVAWLQDDAIVVADAATSAPFERRLAPAADALALSAEGVVWRTRDAAGSDRLWVDGQLRYEVAAPQQLGRPALVGGLLLFHIAGPAGGGLFAIDLVTNARQTLRAEPGAQLSNPVTDGTRMLYVRATGRSQELRLGALAVAPTAGDALLLEYAASGQRDVEHEHGRHRHGEGPLRPQRLPPLARPGVVDTLWTTALTDEGAYVTRLRAQRGAPATADILRVPVPPAG